MNPANLPFNWVDIVILAAILVGISRGKKRGISEELLDVLQWLVIVAVGAFAYQPVGLFVAGYTRMDQLICNIGSYIAIALSLKLLFSWLRRLVGEKVAQTEVFGRGEYVFGMVAGGVRFSCIVLAVASLIHARHFSAEQLAEQERAQEEVFGSIRLPTWGSIQRTVFEESAMGKFMKVYLEQQLLEPTPYSGIGKTPAEHTEKMLNDIMSP